MQPRRAPPSCPALLVWGLVVAACGGEAPPAATAPAATASTASAASAASTAGGEAPALAGAPGLAVAPAVGPLVPAADYAFRLRIDLRQTRGNPLEPELRRFLGELPPWRRFLDATGIDPIADMDRLVVGSPGPGSERWLLFAQTRTDRARVRGAIERYASAFGAEVRWSERRGREVGAWPVGDGLTREVTLLDGGWLVVGPEAAVRRVEARLAAGETALFEGVPMPWADEAPLVPEDPAVGLVAEGRPEAAFGEGGRGEHVPQAFEVASRVDGAGNVELRWTGRYGDAEEAVDAQAFWDARRRAMADDGVVSMLGLAGPFRDATWSRDGATLTMRLGLSLRQASLLLRFLTPMLASV